MRTARCLDGACPLLRAVHIGAKFIHKNLMQVQPVAHQSVGELLPVRLDLRCVPLHRDSLDILQRVKQSVEFLLMAWWLTAGLR